LRTARTPTTSIPEQSEDGDVAGSAGMSDRRIEEGNDDDRQDGQEHELVHTVSAPDWVPSGKCGRRR
jgi:hypothetical protein